MSTAEQPNNKDFHWVTVCNTDDLKANAGVCALVAGRQVAVFYLESDHRVYAIDNYDPIGKANVLSRGVVGDLKGQVVVASPLYKQHFNLETGQCLEKESVKVATYPARIEGTRVQIGAG
ncbi:MAG: nitrite reductase small subunit NirD [Gammaproteobacteria bacterium]